MFSADKVRLGVFSRTFERDDFSDVLDAVVDNNLELLHLNLKSAGVDPFDDGLGPTACKAIRAEIDSRGLTLTGVSCTFNAVHPDLERRARETTLATELISHVPELGTNFASLSTGTRDPDDMWRGHPANEEPSAWADLQRTLERLLEAAHASDVMLGIEPERNNVVSSAVRGRRLLDEVGSERLKVILDPANLLSVATIPRQDEIISEALELLAPDVHLVHAKDFSERGDCGAGLGLVDFELLFERLNQYDVHEPLLLHELPESDVRRARGFLLETAGQATTPPSTLPR